MTHPNLHPDWITDRLPTAKDADVDGDVCIPLTRKEAAAKPDGIGIFHVHYSLIVPGQPWWSEEAAANPTPPATPQFDEEARLLPNTPAGRWVVNYEEPPGEARKSAESATKPRLDLLPTGAVEQITEVLTYGAAKYDDNNWCRGARWGRYYAALLRHVFAWWRGENTDPETGMSHLAHAGCCLLFLMEYQRNSWGTDDRFTGPDNKPFKKHDLTPTDLSHLPDDTFNDLAPQGHHAV